jgi:hypothetical protein
MSSLYFWLYDVCSLEARAREFATVYTFTAGPLFLGKGYRSTSEDFSLEQAANIENKIQ